MMSADPIAGTTEPRLSDAGLLRACRVSQLQHGAARGGWGSQRRRNGTICQRKRYAQDPDKDTEMVRPEGPEPPTDQG